MGTLAPVGSITVSRVDPKNANTAYKKVLQSKTLIKMPCEYVQTIDPCESEARKPPPDVPAKI